MSTAVLMPAQQSRTASVCTLASSDTETIPINVSSPAPSYKSVEYTPWSRTRARSSVSLHSLRRHGSMCQSRPKTFHELGQPMIRTLSVSGDAATPRSAGRLSAIAIEPRRASSYTTSTSPNSAQMRRESFAEKVEIEESLSRSSSPQKIAWKQIDSPSQRSHWSPDNSDAEEEEEIEVCAARKISLVDATGNFAKASKIGPMMFNPRRGSLLSQLSRESRSSSVDEGLEEIKESEIESSDGPHDVVKLVNTMRSNHVEETQRLNEIISVLTQRLAAVENELAHTKDSITQAKAARHSRQWSASGYALDRRPTEIRRMSEASPRSSLIKY